MQLPLLRIPSTVGSSGRFAYNLCEHVLTHVAGVQMAPSGPIASPTLGPDTPSANAAASVLAGAGMVGGKKKERSVRQKWKDIKDLVLQASWHGLLLLQIRAQT